MAATTQTYKIQSIYTFIYFYPKKELTGTMDLCVQTELNRNPDQSTHSHFSDQKPVYSKNFRDKSFALNNPEVDLEQETIKSLIKTGIFGKFLDS